MSQTINLKVEKTLTKKTRMHQNKQKLQETLSKKKSSFQKFGIKLDMGKTEVQKASYSKANISTTCVEPLETINNI